MGKLKVFKWITNIKEPYTLYLVIRDPRTQLHYKLYASAIIGLIVAYTLSPLDIIPDTIPVLGWMDDLILIPIAFTLIGKLLPQNILIENRALASKKVNRAILKVVLGVSAFFMLWAVTLAAVGLLALKLVNG